MRLKTLLILFVLFYSCSSSDETNEETTPTHVKYFGFTIVDTYWDDPTDSSGKTDYSDEVAPFSNIADILVLGPQDDITEKLDKMEQFQMKAVLHLNEIFFELEDNNAPSGTNYQLRQDYRNRWDTFVVTNALEQNKTKIRTFYIGEEPTWNGISFIELQEATDYVKSSIPEIPIMVIEASPALNDFEIPSSADWVGFDHYFIKDPANHVDFLSELNGLKSKLSPTQKLVLVMDTHYIDFAHGDFGGISLNEMDDIASSYYELAKAEPLTIALIGYFWPSGFDADNAIGARNMPKNVKDVYINIGKEITGK